MSAARTSHKRKPDEPVTRVDTPYQSVLEVDMDGKLVPPIRFAACDTLPLAGAVYIEALHEIFTEIKSEEERRNLLRNINALLQRLDIQVFIDIAIPVEECIANIQKYLGNNSRIEIVLLHQKKHNIKLVDFKANCHAKNIKNVLLGGVYGRNCVWVAARILAKNVIAMQLGDKHPNIRFADDPEVHRFDNAIIWPGITEGYIDHPFTFPNFLIFPEVRLFHVKHIDVSGVFEKAEEQLTDSDPDALGVSYADNFDEFNNPDEHANLFNAMISAVAKNEAVFIHGVTAKLQDTLPIPLIQLVCAFSNDTCWGAAHNLFSSPQTPPPSQPAKKLKATIVEVDDSTPESPRSNALP